MPHSLILSPPLHFPLSPVPKRRRSANSKARGSLPVAVGLGASSSILRWLATAHATVASARVAAFRVD
uniref:Uncharacterized protein n=1 Tax=Leersia perrieri TaxID=77586 RepID=A0A0D9WUI4_9ORYZ